MKHDTFNKLTELEYPVTRPFPSSWRCFGPLVLLLCVPVLILLTLLNVSTVGRENVAVESTQFGDDSRSWLAILSGTLSARACEPHRFLLGDIFRTNLGSFDYSLVSADHSNSKAVRASSESVPNILSSDAPAYGFAYRMENIAESCYSSNATSPTSLRTLTATADLSTFTVDGAPVQFELNRYGTAPSVPYGVEPSVQLRLFHPTKPLESDFEIISGINPDVQRDKHRLAVRGLVDSMAVDLLESMRFAFASEDEVSLMQITASARMDCQEELSASKPVELDCPFHAQVPFVESSVGRVSRGKGDIEFIDLADSTVTYPAGLTVSQLNYFSILAAASLVDIGRWEDNALLSSESFNRTVDPNEAVSLLYRNQQGVRSIELGNVSLPTPVDSRFYDQSLSNAAMLRSSPNLVLNGTLLASPIWAVNYLCRTTRLKAPLELIISVVVADISLFGALWAGFMVIATALARGKGDSSPPTAEKASPSSSKPMLPRLAEDLAQQSLLYNRSSIPTSPTSPASPNHGIGEVE